MPIDTTVELERGECCYWEMRSEFDRRDLPENKRCAACWEAGFRIGQATALSAAALEMLRKNAEAKPPHWMERQQVEETGREVQVGTVTRIGREWA